MSPYELDEVLRRARGDGLTELAIVGPPYKLHDSTDDWPAWLRGYRTVYLLRRVSTHLAAALGDLDQLRSLLWMDLSIGAAGAEVVAARLVNLSRLVLIGAIGDRGASAIATLENLESLDLTENGIGDEGATQLARLTSLSSLGLSGNSISDRGVVALAKLSQLSSLNLSSNRAISDVGAQALSGLRGLISLNLSHNAVGDEGARALAELSELSVLNLAANHVGDTGVAAIASLSKLRSLGLSDNSGIGDEGASALASLELLESLALSRCAVSDAGARALRRLTNLSSLDLFATGITDLRPFADLPRLEVLDVGGTRVSDLSPLVDAFERGLLVRMARPYGGRGLFLQDCPLVRPPPEVVVQGQQAVLNYFQELRAQEVDHLFEAKVLIVGEGGAGKTSLLRRLYQPDRELPAVDETTRGIEIHRHSFLTTAGRPFTLNLWDFGGQQIYHATHQFFLTKNALYVLVDDTKRDAKSVHDDGFKYWLEVIEALSVRSPVLIFQNEKGGRGKIIDQAGIKARFPNVIEVHGENLESPGSARTLRRAIERHVQRLSHVGEAVPAGWVSIRHALEARGRQAAFISQRDYFDIYAQHLPFDRQKALFLSCYLHELGVFLHFQDDLHLRDTVILQNHWATEAVFRVLDDEGVKDAHGRFTVTDCDRIWESSGYSDMQPELLALMEKFEICYRLADSDPARWIAPQLLSPSAPPELDVSKRAGDLVLHYRYEFLPKGLINRLMVRLHRFVSRPEQAWASGVLFEREGTWLLARTATSGTEIVLRARGPESQALLSVVASDMDALNEKFHGLRDKVAKWVPCCCVSCAASDAPELFEEKRLRKRKQDGKLRVECPGSYADVSVLELLDGIDRGSMPVWGAPALGDKQGLPIRTVRIFLASSSELQTDRDAFELFTRQCNDELEANRIKLEVVRWERSRSDVSKTGSQDAYNALVRGCDIFVGLFATKANRYTVEEFRAAHEAFKARGRPFIYTYFRDCQISESDLQSLGSFQRELAALSHFPTYYKSTQELELRFIQQVKLLLRDGSI